MQIIDKIALITINETMVVIVVSFLIFLFIINRILFRPLQKVMEDRDDYMENLQKDTSDMEREIIQLADQLAEKESAARLDAQALRKEVENNGRDSAADIHQSVRNEVLDLNKKNMAEVEGQIIQARKHLHSEAEALVTGIMEKVLNRRLAS